MPSGAEVTGGAAGVVGAAIPARDGVTAEVADTFVELVRAFVRARQRMLAAAAHDVEWSAHVVLKALSLDGPLRLSALAERLESDPSTVSRQVAALVKDGLLERRADPVDGRASLLVPTEKAAAVIGEHDAIRLEHFGRMLADWTDRDLRRFADLLGRFTHDFESANHDWVAERLATPPGPAEGNNR